MDHVTEEEVMDVARAIMIRGERVSTNKIRSALGRGSYSTIMAILVKNGIKTSKSGVITDNTTGGSMELLHELKNNLIKEQYRHELLKKELADKYKHIDISSIILFARRYGSVPFVKSQSFPLTIFIMTENIIMLSGGPKIMGKSNPTVLIESPGFKSPSRNPENDHPVLILTYQATASSLTWNTRWRLLFIATTIPSWRSLIDTEIGSLSDI